MTKPENRFSKELIESMRQAATHAKGGKVPGMRVTAKAGRGRTVERRI
jgi:hypothetical protein